MSKVDSPTARALTIKITEASTVSALWLAPSSPAAAYVFAHGAGAGMTHSFMTALSEDLCRAGIATLRYQFPYMEQGSKRTDAPALCHATVRAAVREAARLAPGLPLFAGGKSFGGRMTSQAQAIEPLPGTLGLIFVGFPLHPANQPDAKRAEHLFEVQLPMLFLQGDRDALASLEMLQPVVKRLGKLATLQIVEDADHSFHVRVKSGSTDEEVRRTMAGEMEKWMAKVAQ